MHSRPPAPHTPSPRPYTVCALCVPVHALCVPYGCHRANTVPTTTHGQQQGTAGSHSPASTLPHPTSFWPVPTFPLFTRPHLPVMFGLAYRDSEICLIMAVLPACGLLSRTPRATPEPPRHVLCPSHHLTIIGSKSVVGLAAWLWYCSAEPHPATRSTRASRA